MPAFSAPDTFPTGTVFGAARALPSPNAAQLETYMAGSVLYCWTRPGENVRPSGIFSGSGMKIRGILSDILERLRGRYVYNRDLPRAVLTSLNNRPCVLTHVPGE